MVELVFEVTQEADGGYFAECLTLDIFSQADTWAELRANVREAVRGYFFDRSIPESVRLHLVRDEVLGRYEDAPATWRAQHWWRASAGDRDTGRFTGKEATS